MTDMTEIRYEAENGDRFVFTHDPCDRESQGQLRKAVPGGKKRGAEVQLSANQTVGLCYLLLMAPEKIRGGMRQAHGIENPLSRTQMHRAVGSLRPKIEQIGGDPEIIQGQSIGGYILHATVIQRRTIQQAPPVAEVEAIDSESLETPDVSLKSGAPGEGTASPLSALDMQEPVGPSFDAAAAEVVAPVEAHVDSSQPSADGPQEEPDESFDHEEAAARLAAAWGVKNGKPARNAFPASRHSHDI